MTLGINTAFITLTKIAEVSRNTLRIYKVFYVDCTLSLASERAVYSPFYPGSLVRLRTQGGSIYASWFFGFCRTILLDNGLDISYPDRWFRRPGVSP